MLQFRAMKLALTECIEYVLRGMFVLARQWRGRVVMM